MKVKNPIIRGFYPDPSICKAKGKYYLACSSFEYFPGVPLFESEDLLHWRQIGHCLTRKNQVNLHKVKGSGGVFAPTLRYHEGRFYMVTNNNTYQKNFYVFTDDIYGEWSEPVFVEQGGIDPSLFFEDGKAYFTSNGTDESDGKACIYQCEIDIKTGEMLTESRPVWKGSGGRYLESPHLYHFGEWYYLMAAEGGTEYGHMVTYARGKTPYGPFEEYAGNPVLTNRNLGGNQNHIQGIGHGDLITTENGNCFMVCLGFRIQSDWMSYHHLGREVFLVPIFWTEDGWFHAGVQGTVEEEMELSLEAEGYEETGKYDVTFEKMKQEPERWCHLREYNRECYRFTEEGVQLFGNHFTLNDTDAPAFLGVRQSEFDTDLEVTLAGDAPEAGITFYLSEEHHYDLAVQCEAGKRKLLLRLCVGDVKMVVKETVLPAEQTEVRLKVTSNGAEYHFSGKCGEEEIVMGTARTKYLSSEVAGGFTGTVMGMYAVNPEEKGKKAAEFKNLIWKQGTDRSGKS